MHLSSFFAFLAKNLGLFFSLLPKMLNLPKFMLYWAGERCIISTLGLAAPAASVLPQTTAQHKEWNEHELFSTEHPQRLPAGTQRQR